jgi:hypothetical protein
VDPTLIALIALVFAAPAMFVIAALAVREDEKVRDKKMAVFAKWPDDVHVFPISREKLAQPAKSVVLFIVMMLLGAVFFWIAVSPTLGILTLAVVVLLALVWSRSVFDLPRRYAGIASLEVSPRGLRLLEEGGAARIDLAFTDVKSIAMISGRHSQVISVELHDASAARALRPGPLGQSRVQSALLGTGLIVHDVFDVDYGSLEALLTQRFRAPG